ncbi:hypothetical protein MD484_g5991, partial [Candolleomyces efflorescens]
MAARLLLLKHADLVSPKVQRAIVDFVPWKRMHKIRDMVDIMHNTSLDIFEAAKQSASQGDGVGRKDIISALYRANSTASDEDRIPDHELVAQVSSITFAAMDTTSNAMARILSILGQHPEVQGKLRAELHDAFSKLNGRDELDYDTLSSLPYLDAVVKETLRVYAPLPFIVRESVRDAVLPLQKPIPSEEGKPVDSVFVPKGSKLMLSLLSCNTDPDIWGPDAREWKPERWMAPLPSSVLDAHIPGVYSKLDKKIIWEWNSVVQPTTEDAEITANGTKVLRLPLIVGRVPT